jgi:hypothetical protein
LQHVSAEMGYRQFLHNRKITDCVAFFLNIFWYYVLNNDNSFRPKYVVRKLLLYIYIYIYMHTHTQTQWAVLQRTNATANSFYQ